MAPYSMLEGSLVDGTVADRKSRFMRDSKHHLDEKSKMFSTLMSDENSYDEG